jgi:hypothetical protein
MKLKVLSVAAAVTLGSTFALAQGGGGGGGGAGGAGGGGSSGSTSAGSVGSSVGSSISGPSDVGTSGALDRTATQPLNSRGAERSDTRLGPSDPRIGQNSRNARASTNRWDRHLNDRHSPVDRIRR